MRYGLSFVVVLLIGFSLGVAFHRAGLLNASVATILPKPVLTKKSVLTMLCPDRRLKAALQAAFPAKANVVMVGDSLTDLPDWTALFANARIANYGISGDTTDGALRRLDPILSTGARTAFVMLGINDIHTGVPAATTIANFRRLIDTLRTAGMSVWMGAGSIVAGVILVIAGLVRYRKIRHNWMRARLNRLDLWWIWLRS